MNNKIKLGAVLYIVLVVGLSLYISSVHAVRTLPEFGHETDASAFCQGGLMPQPSLCANYNLGGAQ